MMGGGYGPGMMGGGYGSGMGPGMMGGYGPGQGMMGGGYGPGWDAFQKLLQEWRDRGDMEGLVLGV